MTDCDPSELTRFLSRLRTVRSFEARPVPPEALEAILEVARWSGSSQNQQEWQLVVVTDPDALHRLAAASPSAGHLARAPLAIAVVMPNERKITDAFDEGRIVERILLAAKAQGLAAGMAWVTPDEASAKVALGVPEDRKLRTVIAIGYPDEAGRRPKAAPGRARRGLDELVHVGRWGTRR